MKSRKKMIINKYNCRILTLFTYHRIYREVKAKDIFFIQWLHFVADDFCVTLFLMQTNKEPVYT